MGPPPHFGKLSDTGAYGVIPKSLVSGDEREDIWFFPGEYPQAHIHGHSPLLILMGFAPYEANQPVLVNCAA